MNPTTSTLLVDDWTGKRSVALELMQIVGFSLLTAVLAQIRIPLPFTPVPITGQTLAVLLAGAILGARRGFLSQALYLGLGAAGLHFAGGSLVGPTAGYLWTFPLAALLVGVLVERRGGQQVQSLTIALILGSILILMGGVSWLSISLRVSISQALLLGAAPFWLGDVLKIAFAVLLVRALPRRNQKAAA